MSKKKNHILSAIESIAQAHQELERTVSNHGKIIESQGKDIAALEQKVVAEKYGVSSARVSQIAPRRNYN